MYTKIYIRGKNNSSPNSFESFKEHVQISKLRVLKQCEDLKSPQLNIIYIIGH